MKQQIIRDVDGRIMGLVSDYWNNEDESYNDYKEHNVTFPIHNQYDASECVTYHISELKNK